MHHLDTIVYILIKISYYYLIKIESIVSTVSTESINIDTNDDNDDDDRPLQYRIVSMPESTVISWFLKYFISFKILQTII